MKLPRGQMGRTEFLNMMRDANVTAPREAFDSPMHFMSRPEVAEHIGVKRGTLNRYTLPPADAWVGKLPGWSQDTIDAWHAARPSQRNKS